MTTLFGWGPMFDCPSPSPFVMKSDIQLQMLGVAAGVVDESQSMCWYGAFFVDPGAPRLDDKNEADVAAFAREALMSLCSTEPARRRQCARSRCARATSLLPTTTSFSVRPPRWAPSIDRA